MAQLNETPRAGRVRIAFFGLRNAGKSTLVNAFTGQNLAIVSATPGTTTDPVSKAMEILPLGPCFVTDTAGLDDEGALGAKRVEKTLEVLETADIAVWVASPQDAARADLREMFLDACRRRKVVALDFGRGDSVEDLKKKIAAVRLDDAAPGLLDGLVRAGDCVVCVCPIDESAPKGRLILPQVQLLRECLDRRATAIVCQPAELAGAVDRAGAGSLVVTDSQAFGEVRRMLEGRDVRLTSFSILFARQKGDLGEFLRGVDAVGNLKDGDKILVAEGCTHHRQCNDIGTVKIPRALAKLSGGKKLDVVFSSGATFAPADLPGAALVVHCGGCMLTRREVSRRVERAQEARVPIVNYGILLAAANGLTGVSPCGLVSP